MSYKVVKQHKGYMAQDDEFNQSGSAKLQFLIELTWAYRQLVQQLQGLVFVARLQVSKPLQQALRRPTWPQDLKQQQQQV